MSALNPSSVADEAREKRRFALLIFATAITKKKLNSQNVRRVTKVTKRHPSSGWERCQNNPNRCADCSTNQVLSSNFSM